jgi:4'-phosphopantetheinyl transferase
MELVATLIPDLPHKELISMLNKQIEENEVNRIMGIANKDHAFRSAAGSLLLAQMVCRISGYPVSSISIHRYPNGKPFLPDFPNLHFNITHTDHLAVLAIDTHLVGVDIEKVASARMAVANRFFSESEKQILKKCSPKKRDRLFFELWTIRESYVKAIGIGIFGTMGDFKPELTASGWQVNHPDTGSWNVNHYTLNSDYLVALCTKNKVFPEAIEMIDFMRLFD